MSVRVVHWGTGETGGKGLRGVIGHPELELVGLYVARPDRVGRDAGELCGTGPTGVAATDDVEQLLALEPECLSYFGVGNVLVDSDEVVRSSLETVARFLRSGCDVVTPTITSLALPRWAPEAERSIIEEACAAGSSSFFATGVEPGFASDVLPVALWSMVDELRSVKVSEIADYGRYPVASMLASFGFGLPLDVPVPLFADGTPLRSWSGVVHELAWQMGVTLDEVRMVTEVAPTEVDVPLGVTVIPAGTIGAIRFELQGVVDGHVVAALEHVNYIHPSVAPEWQYGTGGKPLVYRIEVLGSPTFTCLLDVDHHGTDTRSSPAGMRAVNAIPVVHRAPAGLLGPTDVMVPTGVRRNLHPSG